MADIKKLRKLLKMTQKQFADRLGVAERTVQNWERDETTIPSTKLSQLKELAEKFPKESFSLFEATDSPNAGLGNEMAGISSADLKRILDEMDAQRKSFMVQIERKDRQIEELNQRIKQLTDKLLGL